MTEAGKNIRMWAVTDQGLVRIEASGSTARAEMLHADAHMTCLAVDPVEPTTVYTGSRGSGVWRTDDGGATWNDLELAATDVFSLAVSPADGSLYAGTEPSRLYKSTDRGASWREMEALRKLPSAPTWSFPPRPWTSHVRWIAPNPKDEDLLLVGIELGGLMRSEDGGTTWQDHRPGAQKDVHSLAWHPRAVHRAYEAAGGGAAYSLDEGRSWKAADEGRDRHYTWALAVDPHDPDLWYISGSTGPRQAHSDGDARACIYRRRGNDPWEALNGGLGPTLTSMPYALNITDEILFAGLRDGRLFASDDHGDTWTHLEVEGATLAGLKALG